MEYNEGDIAEDGKGNFMVYRGGSWYPSDENGRPRQRIPRPDYGPNYFELPNGSIVREGPRGGMEKISSAADDSSDADLRAAAELRGRLVLSLGSVAEAQQRMEAIQRGGYNFNQDWGARMLEAIPFDGGTAARIIGGNDYQQLETASRSFESAMLPVFSGAAVTDSEARRFIRANLPALGDSPETLETKARNRRLMINGAATLLGQELPFPELGVFGAMFGGEVQELPYAAAAPVAAQIGLTGGNAPPPPPPSVAPGGLPGATPVAASVANRVFDGAEIVERNGQPFYRVGLNPGQGAPADLVTRYGGDGEITAEEMMAAGYVPDQESGQWLFPVNMDPLPPDGGGSPPPAGPRGGAPVTGAARERAGSALSGFAAFQRGALGQLPFSDEIAAGIGSFLTGHDYADVRRGGEALAQYDRENNAAQRNLGGIAGFTAGMVSPASLAAGRWIANAPKLRYAMTRGAAAGAGAGAIYGAGEAEGGPTERAGGALRGGTAGLMTGAALPPVARTVGGMTDNLTRPIRQAVGDGLRRMTGNPVTAEDAAVRSLLRGTDPDQMAARLEEGRRYGAELTLADVGGSNVQSRTRVAATRQTPGREIAQDFAAGRRSEVQDFAAGLGARISPTSATPQQLDDVLERYQWQASAEAFGAVRGDRVALNRDSIMALRSEEGRAAVKDAARLYASSTDEAERNVAAELNRLADQALDHPSQVEVTVGAADLMARYLNRAGGTDANRNRVFGALGRTIRDDARTQNPGYDTALQDFAQRARLGDAVETGERFLGRGHTGDFVQAAGGMDDQQRAIARTAARAAIERASETGGSAPGLLDKLATGRGQRQRSAALLGPEGAADLQRGARVGRLMVDTAHNVNPRAGSNTYLNAQDDNAQAVGGIVGNLARGRPLSALGGAVDMIRSLGVSDEQAEAIVRLATDPRRTEDAIRILRERFPEHEARRIVSQITPMIAAQSGAASGPQQPRVRMVGPQP